MSTVNLPESTDTRWKVLVSAIQKASLEEEGLRQRRNRPIKSYEQFVAETKQAKRSVEKSKRDDDSNDIFNLCDRSGVQNDFFGLGDWRSDDEDICDDENSSGQDENNNDAVIFKQKKQKCKRNYHSSSKLQAIAEDPEDLWDYSSNSSSSDEKIHRDFEDDNVHLKDQDESSWESISSSSDDNSKNFDEFLKTSDVKCKADVVKSDHEMSWYMPYTNLSQCLLSHYYPEPETVHTRQDHNHNCKSPFSNNKGKRKLDYNKDFTRHGQLSLEERLPIMQVVDALEDVNKVLKEGKLTSRMERVLEYKQDYPFTEGYEEEKLGWCPWLVYKLERLCKRISARQWPH